MADEEDPGKITPAWRLPAQWVRDEGFWRDVATRTAAILVSGLILYLGALILGYVTAPGQRATVQLIIIAVGGFATGATVISDRPIGWRRLAATLGILATTITLWVLTS